MAVMDEFKDEREQLKKAPFKEKWKYFCDYYLMYVLGGIAILCLALWLGHDIISAKDEELYVAFVNAIDYGDSDEFIKEAFMEKVGMNPNKQDITLDTTLEVPTKSGDAQSNYSSMEKISVLMAAQQLDLMISNQDVIGKYANASTLIDLRNVYSEAEMEQFEKQGRLYYVDLAFAQYVTEESIAFLDFKDQIPDPTKPEEMENPIPVGIYLDQDYRLTDNFYVVADDLENRHAIASILVNSSHKDTAVAFIDFLMTAGENVPGQPRTDEKPVTVVP